ncbi:MAG: PfkB family carbohydrate kinase, partial [Alphaproteobacteria bacterium]
DMGFDVSGLIADSSRPTSVKTRYLAGHQQLLRSDWETKAAISDSIMQKLLQQAELFLREAKAVIISDYGKGLLRRDFIAALIALAKKADVPVIVDPKGQDFTIYAGADAVTPNRKELSDATRGAPTATDAEIESAAAKIIKECGIAAVVATRSKDGISVVESNGKTLHLPGAKRVEVFDVSGAGDTVIATIAAALAVGGTFEQAARLANIAGSIVVTKVGTAPIRNAELIAALHEGEEFFAHAGQNRIVGTWGEAAEQARRWRARGLKVGFTNGCFDILHAGHVTYLSAARAECDRLIVGLNRDSSVRILKGPERPVHGEQERAIVLEGLASVDMVVLFGAEKKGDDNTAIELINLLKPDVYFKGGDYTEEQIPESPAVRAGGGKVKIMPMVEGQSTTSSLGKIKNAAA